MQRDKRSKESINFVLRQRVYKNSLISITLKKESRRQFHQHFTFAFLYESALRSFSLIKFVFVFFWPKNISAKGAHNMLMKLTKGTSLKRSKIFFDQILVIFKSNNLATSIFVK